VKAALDRAREVRPEEIGAEAAAAR